MRGRGEEGWETRNREESEWKRKQRRKVEERLRSRRWLRKALGGCKQGLQEVNSRHEVVSTR